MTSATSEREIKRRQKLAEEAYACERRVITSLMASIDGRKWMWMQLEFARLFQNDEGLDPYRMAFDKGQRNFGLKLLQSINRHTPAMYIRMTQENTGVKIEPETEGQDDD